MPDVENGSTVGQHAGNTEAVFSAQGMTGHTADYDAGPVYAEPVHTCPPEGSGIMPCCGRTPFEVPPTDRMTSTERVTCTGVTRSDRSTDA